MCGKGREKPCSHEPRLRICQTARLSPSFLEILFFIFVQRSESAELFHSIFLPRFSSVAALALSPNKETETCGEDEEIFCGPKIHDIVLAEM
jgi:hypothetical protein